MSDTQHRRKLVLTARIEDKSPSHAVIGVFQNGGKAGTLCIDVEYAEEVVGLIATAAELREKVADLAKQLVDVEYKRANEKKAIQSILDQEQTEADLAMHGIN